MTTIAKDFQENRGLRSQIEALNAKIRSLESENTNLTAERFSAALALEQLGVWEFSPATNELWLSLVCRQILNLPQNDPVSIEQLRQRFQLEDSGQIIWDLKDTLLQKGNHEFVQQIANSDGQISWIKIKSKTIPDDNGQNMKYIGTLIDFTEQKKERDKLLLSERLFKSVTQNIPKSLIIIIDKDQRLIAIEGEIMEKMGYSSSIFSGSGLSEGQDADCYKNTKELYSRMLSGEQFTMERNGEHGEVYMVHFVPLKNGDQTVEAGLIIALDITEIKDAEVKSAKLAAIIESSDDAIISKTLNGIITSWNDSAERTFGYTAEEMIGQPIVKLIPEDRQHEEIDILSRLRKGEHVQHFETKRLKKDGTLIDVSLTISPIKDANSTVIGLSKIARDITERKQEEQRKNDFVAIVSHELKTPLTSIIGYLQILKARVGREGYTHLTPVLEKAETQAKKMGTMIQDFLNMAKMEEGKLQISLVTFNLASLIDEIVASLQFHSGFHTLKISVDTELNVYADREKISQVIINLLSNAIKYSPNGGTVTISAIQDGQLVRISVIDEGIGISSADQKRLFERFFRAVNDRVKSISGFGIGLYLVAEILRYHESAIEVESSEGEGATFRFALKAVN